MAHEGEQSQTHSPVQFYKYSPWISFLWGTHRSGLTLLEMYHDGGQYHSRSLTYLTDLISPQTNAIPQYYNNVDAKNRALYV